MKVIADKQFSTQYIVHAQKKGTKKKNTRRDYDCVVNTATCIRYYWGVLKERQKKLLRHSGHMNS